MSAKMLLCVIFIIGCQAQSMRSIQVINASALETQVYHILEGVVEGISAEKQVNLDDVFQCVKDSKVVVDELVQAIQLLKNDNFSDVKSGIKLIGQAIQVLPDAITECKSSEAELQQVAKQLTSLLEQMRHPWHFAYVVGKNLLLNGREVFTETNTAIKDWDNKDYVGFGQNVGKILVQLLVGANQQFFNIQADPKIVALQVFEGLIRGFAQAGGVKAETFKECVSDTETTALDFYTAVKQFEQNNEDSVREGLKQLAEGLKTFPKALVFCTKTSISAIKLAFKLQKAIASVATPQTFAFHIGKDLLVNGRNIYKEMNTAVYDWNHEEYNDFGYQVGKALEQLLVGATQDE